MEKFDFALPEGGVLEDALNYLDAVREIGAINMFGAGPYLAKEFGLDHLAARAVMKHWMKSFGERHPA